MIMRYHIGLGIGHTYAHFRPPSKHTMDEPGSRCEDVVSDGGVDPVEIFEGGVDELGDIDRVTDDKDKDSDSNSENEDEDEDGGDSEEDNDGDESDRFHSEGSDEEFVAWDEMYNYN